MAESDDSKPAATQSYAFSAATQQQHPCYNQQQAQPQPQQQQSVSGLSDNFNLILAFLAPQLQGQMASQSAQRQQQQQSELQQQLDMLTSLASSAPGGGGQQQQDLAQLLQQLTSNQIQGQQQHHQQQQQQQQHVATQQQTQASADASQLGELSSVLGLLAPLLSQQQQPARPMVRTQPTLEEQLNALLTQQEQASTMQGDLWRQFVQTQQAQHQSGSSPALHPQDQQQQQSSSIHSETDVLAQLQALLGGTQGMSRWQQASVGHIKQTQQQASSDVAGSFDRPGATHQTMSHASTSAFSQPQAQSLAPPVPPSRRCVSRRWQGPTES